MKKILKDPADMKENSEEKSSIESFWWKWKTIMAEALSK